MKLTLQRLVHTITTWRFLEIGDIKVAGFTGELNSKWAGDNQDQGVAVSVQGNILESEAVVLETLGVSSLLTILPD